MKQSLPTRRSSDLQVYPEASFDPQYRLLMTRQLLDDGKGHLARTAIAPIAFQGHEGKEENLLLAVAQAIDDGKPDAERAKMAETFKTMTPIESPVVTETVNTCNTRWSPTHEQQKQT